MASSYKISAHDEARIAPAALEAGLASLRERSAADPFSNPIVLFAIDLSRRIDRGEISLHDLDALVRDLTVDAFAGRARRLHTYLGETDADANRAAITTHIEELAKSNDFDRFRTTVERPVFGVVLTAHPTFAISLATARALSELGCGTTCAGAPLDEAARHERLNAARAANHRPPEPLTLDIEHEWSLEALRHLHEAIDDLGHAVLSVARTKWPDRWTELTPRLITLASWVGYDQDGRTDVTSMRSFAVRMADKSAALARYRAAIARIVAWAPLPLVKALEPAAHLLDRAIATVARQSALLAEAEREPHRMAEFSRAMVAGRADALVDITPLIELVDSALDRADADDDLRIDLLVLRAALANHGPGLAHVHVRLNTSQLHNAIRRRVGLETDPNDPSNRRSYFNAINDLLGSVRPVTISFASLMIEQASARRLMMTVAQMVKFVDAATPIRFLIAETETGFTLLTALYYARLFGVEDRVEISPLFETEEAFERGERVIEEALKSPHYRNYLAKLGRFAVQFGYSDSGRFVGQMAATYRIERLRLRLAQLLERHGLGSLEVILFNTHGDSIGRGGHPGTLADRFRYLAPSMNRAEFASRGIRVKEEVSFQGGDGFLPLLTRPAALAVVTRILDFAFAADSESSGDPIYSAPDYAAEFFATVQQEFSSFVDDPDYAALLGLYGTNMLYRSGSRPAARISEESSRAPAIEHPSQLRAILNNAILQQMGFFANTIYGLGRAVARDPEMFAVMHARSPRFRRALELAAAALEFSDLDAMRAYAHVFDPGLWLTHSGRTRAASRTKAMRELARLTEKIARHDRVARVIRRLQADHLLLIEHLPPADSARRRRLVLLHALRVALIQRIAMLATAIPAFSPSGGVTREDVIERILGLEVSDAVERLSHIFPIQAEDPGGDDFGETASYQPEAALSYAVEHNTVFEPMTKLFELARAIGSALSHEIGAMG
ncbi:MAG TPA: phosphoenolpyruvate carboxylase [Candidatus Binataceae bacterium]|nr:phosphoenolpyruvate carboxylase [Candidatus Binataceae bacterium]